jgi:Flp pilus assembly protein TadB
MSIAKRHYNKGYYVDINLNKRAVTTVKEEEKTVQSNKNKSLNFQQDWVAQNSVSRQADQNSVTEKNVIVASNEKTQKNIISKQNTKQTIKSKIKSITNPAAKIKNSLFGVDKASTCSANDDGLSIFWVVILILLILWAVGLLAGGFGMGGLINVLLVIALILLILWLLRVV